MGSFAAYAVSKFKKIKEKKRRGFILTRDLVLYELSKLNMMWVLNESVKNG